MAGGWGSAGGDALTKADKKPPLFNLRVDDGGEHWAAPAQPKSETSQLAARALDSAKIGKQCRVVLAALRRRGFMTRRMLVEETELEMCAICGRVNGLEERDLVDVVGLTRCPTTGKLVELIEITEKGRKVLE